MTTIDPYTSLTNQEFLRLHGDRIPEDLLPRIEEVFENYVGRDEVEEIDDLEHRIMDLSEELESAIKDRDYLERKVSKLDEELRTALNEIEDVKTQLEAPTMTSKTHNNFDHTPLGYTYDAQGNELTYKDSRGL